MAVDLLVIPLSRYLAGDFVTPEMRAAWDRGEVARIETVAGETIECPKGTPLGGKEAKVQASKWREAMDRYRASLPHGIDAIEWNEDAAGAEVVETVDHNAWGALVTAARKKYERRGGLLTKLLSGRPKAASHVVNGVVFVDAAFARPFQKGEVIFASLPGALVELSDLEGLDALAGAAREAFQKAAVEAREQALPLIVDA